MNASDLNSDIDLHEEVGSRRGQRKPSRRLQVSLSTILLVTAVIAIWIAYSNALKETERLEARMPGLRLLAGELQIDDPREFAIVQRLPTKYDELIWDVHVPDLTLPGSNKSAGTQLCLALDSIPKEVGRSESLLPLQVVSLTPGRHAIELTYERGEETAELIVLVDGEPQIIVTRPKDWESGKGWSSYSSNSFTVSESYALDEPLMLLSRRFMRDIGNGTSSSPDEPCEGIALWVRRAEPAAAND